MTVVIDGTTGISGVDGTASNPSYEGADSNTGIFFPAADTIAFSEGGVEVGRFDSNANFLFNSGYGSAAIAYGCRAWVNFDGTTNVGGFCTVRASGNVTTVADNGTGDYTINFTNAMPDINYTVVANSGFLAGPGYPAPVALFANNSTGATVTPTVSAARITTRNSAFNPADVAYITAAVFR